MNRLIVLTLLFLSSGHLAKAQEIISLPFRVSGGLMVVQARINGRVGDFVIDTGVEHLVLNQMHFRGWPSAKVFHHLLGTQEGGAFHYVKFELGDSFAKKVYADIIDLRPIERVLEQSVHGLIGTHALRAFSILYFDLVHQRLLLVPKGRRLFEALPFSSPPRDTVAFTWKGYLPVVRFTLEATALPLALDTGAEMNLISEEERDLLLDFRPEPGRQVALRGFGKEVARKGIAKLSGLRVGERSCPTLHFAYASLARFNRLLRGKPLSGIIHPNAFGAMQWAIHFRKKEIYLWGRYPRAEKPVLAIVD